MAIYQVTEQGLQPIEATSFTDADFRKRQHHQQLLKQKIDVFVPDTLVISEGFEN
jgi:hypothetical protein